MSNFVEILKGSGSYKIDFCSLKISCLKEHENKHMNISEIIAHLYGVVDKNTNADQSDKESAWEDITKISKKLCSRGTYSLQTYEE